MFDMGKMMQQAKKVQDKMMSIQDELAQLEINGQSKDGNVQVLCNGKLEFQKVTIKPEFLAASKDNPSAVEQGILEALQDASNKIMKITQDKMTSLTAGINIPGLKLPF